MSHWSEDAKKSADSSMSERAADKPVQSCPIKGWEALAEVEDNPGWETDIKIEEPPAPPATPPEAASS